LVFFDKKMKNYIKSQKICLTFAKETIITHLNQNFPIDRNYFRADAFWRDVEAPKARLKPVPGSGCRADRRRRS
jgi:hypothetical protein